MQLIAYHGTPPMDIVPLTTESIALAYAENCVQRAVMGIGLLPPPVIDSEGARLVGGVKALHALCDQFGFDRVQDWLDRLRASDERPANRCLADGAALNHGICVQCGRDNS